ncbi:MAG: ATP-binding protein [Sandaracinaceae bacterium]|nr:ATP-binding protein [Sandaracinaceae bacterium]
MPRRQPPKPPSKASRPTKPTETTEIIETKTELDDDLDQLLESLKFKRLREVLSRELARAERDAPSYADFLRRILREELQDQQMRFLEHRIRRAKLPERWVLDTFPWKRQPAVKRAAMEQIAELDFVPRAENLVFVGPTGVGKTGIASAILLRALEHGYRGLFIKAQDLFDEMYQSLADHSSRRLLNRLSRLDLLLIDEMGYLNLRPEQSNIFFKLMEERYGQRATIITTNLDYDDWYDFLGNKPMVAALLDRLRHHCHTIRIDGPSLRDPSG